MFLILSCRNRVYQYKSISKMFALLNKWSSVNPQIDAAVVPCFDLGLY